MANSCAFDCGCQADRTRAFSPAKRTARKVNVTGLGCIYFVCLHPGILALPWRCSMTRWHHGHPGCQRCVVLRSDLQARASKITWTQLLSTVLRCWNPCTHKLSEQTVPHIACHSHLRTTVLPHKRQIDSALNIDTCAAIWERMRNKGHSPVDVDHNTQRCSVDWHGVLDTGPHTPESIQSAKQSPAKQQQHAAASVAARARSSLCLIAMRVPVTAKNMQDETVRRHKWWSCSQQYTSVVSDHRIFHAQHGARPCAIADRHLLAWNALFRLFAVVTTWFPARDTFRKLPQKLICAGLV